MKIDDTVMVNWGTNREKGSVAYASEETLGLEFPGGNKRYYFRRIEGDLFRSLAGFPVRIGLLDGRQGGGA